MPNFFSITAPEQKLDVSKQVKSKHTAVIGINSSTPAGKGGHIPMKI